MSSRLYRESAKIYEFPVRVRATSGVRRDEAERAVTSVSPRVVRAELGSGWYHEAAIEEARRELER